MFKISRFSHRSLVSAAVAAALSVSLMTQASLAAEPDRSQVQAQSLAAPAPVIAEIGTCSYASPCVVARTTDGYVLDFGGPAIQFERVDE